MKDIVEAIYPPPTKSTQNLTLCSENGWHSLKPENPVIVCVLCGFPAVCLSLKKLCFSDCWSAELLYNRDLSEEIQGNQPSLLPIGYSNQALHSQTEKKKMCNYSRIISPERRIDAAKV